MPAAIGGLIIGGFAAATGATGVAGFSLASTTFFGIGIVPIVGSAAILGAAVGKQAPAKPEASA